MANVGVKSELYQTIQDAPLQRFQMIKNKMHGATRPSTTI